MKKPIERKTIIRLSKGCAIYSTVKALLEGYSESPLANYRDAIKKGFGMSRLKATKILGQLIKDADKKGITAIVVFLDDPHKEFNESKSKVTSKKKPVKKKAKRK